MFCCNGSYPAFLVCWCFYAIVTLIGAAEWVTRPDWIPTSAFLPIGLETLLVCMPLLCKSINVESDVIV
jgi:hypothetical protein